MSDANLKFKKCHKNRECRKWPEGRGLRATRALNILYDKLQSKYYSIQVCLPKETSGNQTAETAILNYLSKIKDYFKMSDGISFAAKMVVNSDIDKNNAFCITGENDFQKMMGTSRREEVLKWLWLVWRENLGTMKEPHEELVGIENRAAKRNGYQDIGDYWRDELEIPDLRQFCRRLYASVRPLYTMIHGVVRFYLRRLYGDVVHERGPIPAHLLGSLWSHNWESLIDLITPKSLDLDQSIKNQKWTVHHMVKHAEDFYQSMGLPGMTDTFWRESVFEDKNGVTRCHGTAADMFRSGDYRLLYCSGTTMEDFYVLHHELGHIQYYMAYAHQPAIFRQANTAFHESIGDAIMYGVMTPQHLHRLSLVNDSLLYVNTSNTAELRNNIVFSNEMPISNRKIVKEFDEGLRKSHFDRVANKHSKKGNYLDENDLFFELGVNQHVTGENLEVKPNKDTAEFESNVETHVNNDNSDNLNTELTSDEIILLKQALFKIPQIPFALVIDEYRWKYFEGSLEVMNKNQEFWDLALELQGIVPPEERGEQYFDIGAVYHVSDNTPFIRYFLSSFIQHQIFEALCRAAVFGNRDLTARVPDTISLHRCDIYGSRTAGKLLRDFMSRGDSQHWTEILRSTTGNTDITASALLRYYRPLYRVLSRIVKKHNIPLGWTDT